MITREIAEGEIEVKFKCGCMGILRLTHEYDVITGDEDEVRFELQVPCDRHEGAKVDASLIWDSMFRGGKTYSEFFDEVDSYEFSESLDAFLCED